MVGLLFFLSFQTCQTTVSSTARPTTTAVVTTSTGSEKIASTFEKISGPYRVPHKASNATPDPRRGQAKGFSFGSLAGRSLLSVSPAA
jgi:hypothetical protein